MVTSTTALIGRRPYKDDRAPIPDTERVAARRALALALGSDALVRHYGFRVEGLDAYVPELCEDTRGDHLDSIMCAVQAAWAWDRRDRGYGIPPHADPAEGWIADPATATA